MRLSDLSQRDQGRGPQPFGDCRRHDLQLAFALGTRPQGAKEVLQ